MIFSSLDFFYFFWIVIPLYFALPDRWRNTLILLASYFFYAYWSVKYLFLLIFTMVLDYVIAIRIENSASERVRGRYLFSSIVLNLGVLFLFKYLNLFADLFAMVTGRTPLRMDVVLPFGISFYTFHAMSYTAEILKSVYMTPRI